MALKNTSTSIFIVPTLKIDKNKLRDNNFINAYVKDAKKEVQYENAAYLLFKPDDIIGFRDFVNGEYERTSCIIDDYDYDGGFVVLVYTLDPKFAQDFELVKKGRYSKTSKEFQELFPKVVKLIKGGLYKDELSLQYRVFTKAADLREYWEERIAAPFNEEMEVWEGFDEENETLDIDKIKATI